MSTTRSPYKTGRFLNGPSSPVSSDIKSVNNSVFTPCGGRKRGRKTGRKEGERRGERRNWKEGRKEGRKEGQKDLINLYRHTIYYFTISIYQLV